MYAHPDPYYFAARSMRRALTSRSNEDVRETIFETTVARFIRSINSSTDRRAGRARCIYDEDSLKIRNLSSERAEPRARIERRSSRTSWTRRTEPDGSCVSPVVHAGRPRKSARFRKRRLHLTNTKPIDPAGGYTAISNRAYRRV